MPQNCFQSLQQPWALISNKAGMVVWVQIMIAKHNIQIKAWEHTITSHQQYVNNKYKNNFLLSSTEMSKTDFVPSATKIVH